MLVGLVGCNQSAAPQPAVDAGAAKDLDAAAGDITLSDLAEDSQPDRFVPDRSAPDRFVMDSQPPDAACKKPAPWLLTNTGKTYFRADSVAVDLKSNIYVVAHMDGAVAIGNHVFGKQGQDSAVVIKLNACGKVLWGKAIECDIYSKKGYSTPCWPSGIAVDAAGNSYIVGKFSGTMYFEKGIKISAHEPVIWPKWPQSDVFVAKFDTHGQIQWAKEIGEYQEAEVATAIDLDGQGNIFIAGRHESTTSFGNLKVAGGKCPQNQSFVAKLDANGKFVWVTSPKGNCTTYPCKCSDERADYLAVGAGGDSVISGRFWGKVTYGSSVLEHYKKTKYGDGEYGAYVARLDAKGGFKWAKKIPGRWPADVVLEKTGNVIFNRLGTLERLSASGKTLWSKQICNKVLGAKSGGTVLDSNGNMYISGNYYENIQCGPYAGKKKYISSMVLAIGPNGKVLDYEIAYGAGAEDIARDKKFLVVVGIQQSAGATFGKNTNWVPNTGLGFIWKFPL